MLPKPEASSDFNSKIAYAREIIERAIAEHCPIAVVALFSGGRDSTVATALSLQYLTHAAHINTGIGVPQTTEWVRQTCKDWLLPLIELVNPSSVYEGIVAKYGFPGPGAHRYCYILLKERRLWDLRRMLKKARKDRILFITGIRLSESARRMITAYDQETRRDGSAVWVSPILHFTSKDRNDYILKHNLPINPVVDLLHMSGECLCGAFAKPDEIKEIELWFPETANYIHELERKYGGLWGPRGKRQKAPGPLCVGCQ